MRRPPPPRLQNLRDLCVVGERADAVSLAGDGLRLELCWLASDLFRLRATTRPEFAAAPSWAVCRSEWRAVTVRLVRSRRRIRLETAQASVELDLRTGGVRLFGADHQLRLRSDPARCGFTPRGEAHWAFALSGQESFLALGESSGPFDRRGMIQEFWNTDALGHGGIHPGLRHLYTAIPFTVLWRDGQAVGWFWDNPARQRWDLGQTDRQRWQLQAASGEMNFYGFTGPSVPHIVQRYAELTGRMPLPPRWALGYHQCRYSYETRAELEGIARQLRRRRIPCDALYLDIHHMAGFRVFTFGRAFAAPADMLRRLRRRGFHTVAIVDPGVKVDAKYGVYRRGRALEAYVRTPDARRAYIGRVWPGRAVFPDFLSGRVRQWWGREQSRLQRLGVAGFWNDMNEPADFLAPGKTLPEGCWHRGDAGPVRHARAHNVYGMQMARASFEGALRHQPDRRPFIITRAAYAGTQRYAMVWTGDNASSWEQLGDSLQMLLNLGLSGFPFCGSDAGGFLDNCTPELYVRWMQLAAFTPFYRNHTMTGTLAHEPWSFGPATEARVRSAIELRYQLLPYWYCLFAEAHRTGAPPMRPLVWQYQHDPVAAACGDQFLLGPFLMVAPVLRQGAVARSVYLPEGVWFDFWTGRRQVGPGHRVAEAPLDRLPLFVRGGAILPMADLRQHTSGPPERVIHLHLWPGGQGELDWYEDDGATPRYADGAFHLRTIRWTGTTLSVGSVQGEYASRVQGWRLVAHGLRRRPTFEPACSEVRFDPATGLCTCRLTNRAAPFRVSLAKG